MSMASLVCILCVTLALGWLPGSAKAEVNQQPLSSLHEATQEYINQFKEDPERFMDRVPEKQTKGLIPRIFSDEDISQRRYVDAKALWREKLCNLDLNPECAAIVDRGRAPSATYDQPSSVVDNPDTMIRTLTEIDRRKLHSAKLTTAPWSDYYWPIFRGTIGNRYADGFLSMGSRWLSHFDAAISGRNSIQAIWQSQNIDKINRLSPAEKYDLLIGMAGVEAYDSYWGRVNWPRSTWPKGYLTPSQWLQGQALNERRGNVETWMGICHGWAPISYRLERPRQAIEVVAADGNTRITFYPSDIKALLSYFWSETKKNTRFAGGRCNVKDPERSRGVGRVIDPQCFDSNPHTWHLAVVNQVGVNRSSVVIDATYDYEVWNQPVSSYDYIYFNPITTESSYNWRDVAVTAEEFRQDDPFYEFRYASDSYYRANPEKRPHWIVGVTMNATYVAETAPRQTMVDDQRYDGSEKVMYMYDLEINSSGEVVGGEWWGNRHPDFLWNVPESVFKNREYYSPYDHQTEGSWSSDEPLPTSWREQAIRSALSDRKPLAKIVDELWRRSISQ